MRKPWNRAEQRAIVKAATVLVAAHDATEREVRTEGAAWYPERLAFCARLWPEHPERAAGILAATSPMTAWNTNQAYAVRVVTAARHGQSQPAVGTMRMRDAAWRIALGEDPDSVLRGPKVNAFYHSIIGATDRPVIDRWAARAAGWTLPANQGITPRAFYLLADAYTLAAQHLDVEPRYLQATLWIDKRGSGE